MKTSINLRTALLVVLAAIIAFLAYDRYQRFNAGHERLRQDTSRIETMLTENNAERQ